MEKRDQAGRIDLGRPGQLIGVAKTKWQTTVGLGAEGPNGNVMPQRILEWMQDAAANASWLGGYSPDRYREGGYAWFVREIALSIEAPIRYRDDIEIETWVSDLRRFRSHREYRLFANGVLAARAKTDWMLLERNITTGRVRPLRPDQEMLTAFPIISEYAFDPAEEQIPEFRDPEEGWDVAIEQRIVRPTELDRHEHVNHVIYLGWVEDHARTHFGDRSELKSVRIEYVNDAKRGDAIGVQACRKGDRIEHRVTRNEQLVVRTTSLRTF